jgi:ankyrin repeat protein
MNPNDFSEYLESIERAKKNERIFKLNQVAHSAAVAHDRLSVKRYIEQGATLHLLDGDEVHPYNDDNNGLLHVELVKYLLSLNMKIDVRNRKLQTPFHTAVYNGNLEIMDLLLNAGADIEAKEDYRDTPLCWAAYMGHLEALKFLVEKGAKINIINRDNYTPLHWACYKGHAEIAKYLIENNADTRLKNNDGDTPLTSAIENGHTETVLYLIEVEKQKAVEEARKKGQ